MACIAPSAESLHGTPAVYEKKLRWRKYEATDYILEDRSNYSSIELAAEKAKEQFEKEVEEGLMNNITEEAARKEYGDRLRIAPHGAISKGDGSYQAIHDGTHGPAVHPNLKVRDQVR